MTRIKPPKDWDKEPVPRTAYMELMKSLTRLKQLQRGCKKPKVDWRTVYCEECGEFIKLVKPDQCPPRYCKACKERRLLVKWQKANVKRRDEA